MTRKDNSKAWKAVAISTIVSGVRTLNPLRSGEDEFIYIDLSAVSQGEKKITGERSVASSDAPSRARQVVNEGDVLVSTVRPNLNGVALVPAKLHGAIASTGFCVLRAKKELLDDGFLFNWVKSPVFISEMVKKATGASYPAVSDRIIFDSSIPLPPLAEQKRIAAILDQADALRADRRAALTRLDELTQSIFLDMFGDQFSARWESVTVERVAAAENGSIRTGPFGSQLLHSEFTDKGIYVLGIDNVVMNEFRWTGSRYISEEKYLQLGRYTIFPGDVLITIMGTCGRCAIVPQDVPRAINTKHLCCITLNPKKCHPTFLQSYFLLHPIARKYLKNQTKGAIMGGLNMGIIKSMPIVLPPLALQQEFARRVEAVEHLKDRQREHLARLDELFVSLQHRAFRGEL